MRIIPCKGCFHPGERITFIFHDPEESNTLTIYITNLQETVYTEVFSLSTVSCELTLSRSLFDVGGYGVLCVSDTGKKIRTAFDVQNGNTIPRYGFLSDFFPDDSDDSDIMAMAEHHINMVQFYDWSYRHDHLVTDQEQYSDMMGKHNSLSVIRRKIDACHTAGMKTIAYGAVYAAGEEFASMHPEWRLYAGADQPVRFIDVFSIMNLRSGWREHIIRQYHNAITEMGFDGIHMDTYGFPKTALNHEGKIIHLEEDFPSLITDTRAMLPDATLVFNNVGGWPLECTMNTGVDAVYIEVWPPFDRYYHLKQLILKAKESGKPVILAAYPSAFRTFPKDKALYSELLLMCAIQSHGATQLWFGEEYAAITQGYYSDYSRLNVFQQNILKNYDDFFVRYEQLFFNSDLKDVSMTHSGWDNQEYLCNQSFSVSGESGKLWFILRESKNEKLISIINLCGTDTDCWADGQSKPIPQNDIEITLQYFGEIKHVLCASPDDQSGDFRPCQYLSEQGDRSKVLKIKLPTVSVFMFIWISFSDIL